MPCAPAILHAADWGGFKSAFGGVTGGGGGGGSSPANVTDNFDSYADSSNLGGQGNWVAVLSDCIVNKPAADGSVYGSTGLFLCRNTGATFASNQRVEATIDNVSGTGSHWIGPCIRANAGGTAYYTLSIEIGGNYFAISTADDNWGVNHPTEGLVAGDKVALEASGSGSSTRLKAQKDVGAGWVDVWTNQDPSPDYYDNGNPGVWGYSGDSGLRLDDWVGKDL